MEGRKRIGVVLDLNFRKKTEICDFFFLEFFENKDFFVRVYVD